MRLTASVTPEDNGYVAQCLEVDVASQGDTVEQALANLKEALELYFEGEPARPFASPIIASIDVAAP
jgi:predicted RNase H-like HicB family nuclease